MVRELGIGGRSAKLVETRVPAARTIRSPCRLLSPGWVAAEDLNRPAYRSSLAVYSFKSPGAEAAAQLIRYIHRHRIQIVHSFDAPLNVFAVPIARLAGTPR